MVFILIVILSINVTEGKRKIVTSAEDCATCLADITNYQGVCTSKYGYGLSYCCSADDMEFDASCRDAPFCSNWTLSEKMYPLACPHEKYPCGITTPHLPLSLGDDFTVNIDRFFSPVDSCFFNVTAIDKIPLEDLDPYNRKYIMVNFKKIVGMDVYIATAPTAANITDDDVIQVTGAKLNFTQNISQPLFVVLQP